MKTEPYQDRASAASSRQPGAHEHSRAIGEKQEHLDAVVAFTFAGKRRRMFRVLDIFAAKRATGDLPEECRFLLHMQLVFLNEKDPATRMFDDDEWR